MISLSLPLHLADAGMESRILREPVVCGEKIRSDILTQAQEKARTKM